MSDLRRNSRGFTLVEVLVALGVLSIGVLALLNAQGEGTVTAGAVRDRLFAEIVAENLLVETMSQPEDLVMGVTEGETIVAGQPWSWRKSIAATSEQDIKRIDVSVRDTSSDMPLASLTAFRGQR